MMIRKVERARDELIYDLRIAAKSEHTIRSYQGAADRLIRFLKERPPENEEQLVRAMKAFLAQKREEKRADRTIYHYAVVFRTLLRYLSIPESKLTVPRLSQSLPKALSRRELQRFFNAIEDPKYKLIAEILYKTGLRISELLDLRAEDVDYAEGRILVRGKGKKERIVYLDHELARKMKDCAKKKRGRLFPVTASAVQTYFRQTSRRAGLNRNITPHMLRHTFATRLLELGMDIRLIKEILGHSDVSTTQIYTKISEKSLEKELKEKLKNF